MLLNCNLLYSFKHPDSAPRSNYKTLYYVLILIYLCASLSSSNAANILFCNPAEDCDAIRFASSVSNSVCTIGAEFLSSLDTKICLGVWKYKSGDVSKPIRKFYV